MQRTIPGGGDRVKIGNVIVALLVTFVGAELAMPDKGPSVWLGWVIVILGASLTSWALGRKD
jgi:hypothetical protein